MPGTIDELTIGVSLDTRDAEASLRTLSREAASFSNVIGRAFKDAIAGGKGFDDVLKSLALRLAGLAFDRAIAPLSDIIGRGIANIFGAFGLAQGGVLAGGRIQSFARGGVVGSPTLFPMRNGLGLIGEAGAEAVLPLARGGDGKLGVRSDASAPVVINFHVTATDAASFAKSEAQVTAMLARAVGRGRRGL